MIKGSSALLCDATAVHCVVCPRVALYPRRCTFKRTQQLGQAIVQPDLYQLLCTSVTLSFALLSSQIKPAMYRDLEASKDIILKSWYPNVEVQWNTGE